MEELIKYYESVESRLAALDARIAELEAIAAHEAEQEAHIAELTARITALEQALADAPLAAANDTTAEPEVEVELVFNEDEEPEIPEEPIAEEPIAEEPIAEETTPEPAVVEEPVAEEPAPRMGAVSDLRKAISLGDRFLFVRELFGNNGEKFQHAIDDLDKLSSLSEANAYIQRFGWDTESKAYELFQNALKRRFV